MNARNLTRLTALACLSALSAACGIGADDDHQVKPSVEVIDHTKSALSNAGGLATIKGTYGALCHRHTGGDPWSVSFDANGAVTGGTLSVTMNDADCVLSVTGFMSGAQDPESFDAASPIPMSTEYGAAKGFEDADDQLRFYGNAKLSATDFAADFKITLIVSDTPDSSATTQSSTYTQMHASEVSASGVQAPNDTLDLSSIAITVDADDKVLTRTGAVVLADADRAATSYAIVSALAESPTFAQVDAAYAGANAIEISDEASHSVPIESFLSVSDDLTDGLPKWLILRRDESGVAAYQVVKITFQP
jgi:hypothetical protein